MVVASAKGLVDVPTFPCINAECEILGVLRSPAFLVGSSRSLRNKYSIQNSAAALRRAASESTSSDIRAHYTSNFNFQSMNNSSSDGTLSADSIGSSLSSNDETDSYGNSRDHSPLLSAEEEVDIAGFVNEEELSIRPNKRAKISNLDNNGGNDNGNNASILPSYNSGNANVGVEIMPIELLLGLPNRVADSSGFDKHFVEDYRMMSAKPDDEIKIVLENET